MTIATQNRPETLDRLDPGILSQYKELIREQDSRISQISQANLYLQQEVANAKQQVEEMTLNMQTLQDQNSLLKAQTSSLNQPQTQPFMLNGTSSVESNELKEAKSNVNRLEKELRVRDDIIHELEVRLTLPNHEDTTESSAGLDLNSSTGIEVRNLQTQLEALQTALAHKDNEIEALKSMLLTLQNPGSKVNGHSSHETGNNQDNQDAADLVKKLKEDYSTLEQEQEDLLMMLSEQDCKIKEYKKRLKSLGQVLSEDDEDDLEEDLT